MDDKDVMQHITETGTQMKSYQPATCMFAKNSDLSK